MYALVIFLQDDVHFICKIDVLPSCNGKKIQKVKWSDGYSYPAKVLCMHESRTFLHVLSNSIKGLVPNIKLVDLAVTSKEHLISLKAGECSHNSIESALEETGSMKNGSSAANQLYDCIDEIDSFVDFDSDNSLTDPDFDITKELENENRPRNFNNNVDLLSDDSFNLAEHCYSASSHLLQKSSPEYTCGRLSVEESFLVEVCTDSNTTPPMKRKRISGARRFGGPRKSWNEEEKQVVYKVFADCFITEKLPSVQEICSARCNNPILQSRSPQSIKLWIQNQMIKKRRSSSNSTKKENSKKITRERWTPSQKHCFYTAFRDHIEGTSLPSQAEIRIAMEKYPGLQNKSLNCLRTAVVNERNRRERVQSYLQLLI